MHVAAMHRNKQKSQTHRLKFMNLGKGLLVMRVMGHIIILLICPERLSGVKIQTVQGRTKEMCFGREECGIRLITGTVIAKLEKHRKKDFSGSC